MNDDIKIGLRRAAPRTLRRSRRNPRRRRRRRCGGLLVAVGDGPASRTGGAAHVGLTIGLGLGWSVDEFEAVGAPMEQRGRRLDEILDVTSALLVVRADPSFTDIALGVDRLPFTGTRQQVIDDIERTRDLGATELILDLQTSTCSPDELIDTALQLADPHRALLAA